jgi:hypothetical protein
MVELLKGWKIFKDTIVDFIYLLDEFIFLLLLS